MYIQYIGFHLPKAASEPQNRRLLKIVRKGLGHLSSKYGPSTSTCLKLFRSRFYVHGGLVSWATLVVTQYHQRVP